LEKRPLRMCGGFSGFLSREAYLVSDGWTQ
jgi:hypothetical protein